MEVVEEDAATLLGSITGIVIHPDTAKVEGFYVQSKRIFAGAETLFIASSDICRWGTRVTIRHADMLGPLEDRVRLQSLVSEGRPVLGQSVVTESGTRLGTCADVQFDTLHFMVEWLFPRTWWSHGTPVPVTQVIEVRKDVIIVKDTVLPEDEKGRAVPILERLPDAA